MILSAVFYKQCACFYKAKGNIVLYTFTLQLLNPIETAGTTAVVIFTATNNLFYLPGSKVFIYGYTADKRCAAQRSPWVQQMRIMRQRMSRWCHRHQPAQEGGRRQVHFVHEVCGCMPHPSKRHRQSEDDYHHANAQKTLRYKKAKRTFHLKK